MTLGSKNQVDCNKVTEVIVSRSKNNLHKRKSFTKKQPFTVITFSSDVLNVDIKLLKVLVGFRRTPAPYDLFKQYIYL